MGRGGGAAVVLLNLDDQIGVGEPHAVAFARAEHIGIDGAAHFRGHDILPEFLLNPQNYPQARTDRADACFNLHTQTVRYHHCQIARVWFCQMREIAKVGLALVQKPLPAVHQRRI